MLTQSAHSRTNTRNMGRAMKLELQTYTPSEAEAVTGVTQATVRNWRRAGYLPRPKGHARYTIADLLVMFTMGEIVSRGTNLETAHGFAPPAAKAIFQSLIWSTKAFSDDVHAKAKADLGEISEEKAAQIKAQMGGEFSLEMLTWARSQEIIVEAAEQLAGISGAKQPHWLVIWADGSLEFLHDAEDPDGTFFGNIQYNKPYVQGPVMLFCLGALAQMVVDRLPRPAIQLSHEKET